jgi:hypothetical protein
MKYKIFRLWKVTPLAFVIVCSLLCRIENLSAQNPRIIHTIAKLEKDPGAYLGRDLWLTMCQNYENQPGKFYALYVTSQNTTTVNIQVTGGSTSRYPIAAGQVLTFMIPLSWEVTSSGVVEDKGIRVWSNDADITAYMLSRNPATSDGMFVIPTIGWGTEYVVGAYGSLFDGYGNFVYDYPSEFAIIANQDITLCTITPNCDLRMTDGSPVKKAHVPFTVQLNKGQCVQYKSILPQNCDDYDVTGTIVTSNNPVGVIGASTCPNIPCDYLYCDHVCDMMPPVRTWAQTYQTVPFDQRLNGDTYLVVGSKPGQTIKRNGNTFCVLDNKYSYYFRPDISDASQWTSDAPFMLIQYINSSTWESPNGALGDPAEVVVNSVEQYVPHIIFETPDINTNGFSNFANVMVNNDAKNTTTFDGKSIGSAGTQIPIPGSNYTAFRIATIQPGRHEIISDSGVGVYIYGYGSYDSYAWNGSLGIKTFNDPDTIPPIAVTSGDCFNALVTVTDNHKVPIVDSRIASVKLDSIYNMSYTLDPNYQEGVASDSTYYTMNVIDSSIPAILIIEIHDYAGNRTIVTSTYTPQSATLTPPLINYGSGNVNQTICKYFTLKNTGTIPFVWQSIQLLKGNVGFVDSIGDSSPIPVGGSRLIKVCFTPVTPAFQSDTLEMFDGCVRERAIVIGTGGAPDFAAFGEDFGCQLVGSTTRLADATVNNTSKNVVTIDSIWVDDPVHFGFTAAAPKGNNLPFDIAPNLQHAIEFSFRPNTVGAFSTTAHFRSVQIGQRTAILTGSGCAPGAHISKDTLKISDCATAVPFVFQIQDTGFKMIISQVIVAGDPQFGQPISFTDQTGKAVTLPIQLSEGASFLAYLNFTPAPKASGLFSAKVFAIGPDAVTGNMDTTNFATATVQAIWRELDPTVSAINLPPVPFGSPVQTSDFSYCNNSSDSVTLQNVLPLPGPYNFSYSILKYSVGAVTKTLPITLAKNECVNITIQFDPSQSPDSVQTQKFAIVTNACVTTDAAVAQAGVTLGPPTIQGFAAPTILSCDTKSENVTVTNSNPAKSPAMTITNVVVQGANPANFIATVPASKTVYGGSTVQIPVTFIPSPAPGGLAPTNYSANVVVTITDAAGNTQTLTAPVSGSANGMSAIVSSQFAIADQTAKADNATLVTLPINISFIKNGLTDPVDTFGITKIRLVYKYTTDLLQPKGNLLSTAVSLNNGWILDAASAIDNTAGTMTLVLDNPAPLNDATTSLGQVQFYPTVAQSGIKTTTVTLASSDLLTTSGAPVGNCLAVSQQGTQFALIYECGDSALAYYLKNGTPPSMIKPVNPNPVSASSGGIVNFQYATKHEGIVSIIIYDELGKEAARVVNNQYHPAGTYEVRYDASGLRSGSYIYRFQVDNNHASSGRLVVSN